MTFITIEEPGASPRAAGGALFALGFRPFYLLAASFSALAIPLWVLVLRGVISLPLPGIWWHAHEMLFGFAVAVIIGFLYTAGRNWTGIQTPDGKALAGLAALWLAGRVSMAFDAGWLSAVVDFSFLPLAAFGFARVLVQAGSRRNYFIPLMLLVLALANSVFHLARLGVIELEPLRPLWFALGLITLLETIIGGRVIPMFTANTLRGVRQWQHERLNQTAIGATGVALLLWVFDAGWPGGVVALLAAGLQLARCIGWNPWATRAQPLLWSLHLAHGWIPLGLLLLGGVQFGLLPRSAAVHALAIGATGGLIIAMITRTALGHLGRPLRAGRVEVLTYASVQFAALVRITTLIATPALAAGAVDMAALLWSLAFLLYALRYGRWLYSPRPDGRPG